MTISSMLARLSLNPLTKIQAGSSKLLSINVQPKLLFHTTPALLGAPIKKKNRVDPVVEKARIDRKSRKLEKAIRRLKKNSLQLKPIDECEIPWEIKLDPKGRVRKIEPISPEGQERRALLQKEWSRHKGSESRTDKAIIRGMLEAQKEALRELNLVSEYLYQAAIQPDPKAYPCLIKGPVITPPLTNYKPPAEKGIIATLPRNGNKCRIQELRGLLDDHRHEKNK